MTAWKSYSSLPSEGEVLEALRKASELAWERKLSAEFFAVEAESLTIRKSKDEQKVLETSKLLIGVRVNGSGMSFTTDLNSLERALEEAASAARALGEKELYPLGPLVDRVTQKLDVPPWDVDVEKKVSDVLEASKLAKGNYIMTYRESVGTKFYVSTEGREIVQRLSYTIFAANVTLESGGDRGNGYFSFGSRRGYTIDFDRVVEEAVRKAELQLRGKGLEPGEREVLLMPQAIGVMVHEALGHMSEGDHVAAGSPLKMGERVGPEFLTVSDSPGTGEEWGSIFYDDEGTKPKKVEIIKNGVVNGFLLDRYYAKLLGMEPTGNGRQEDPSKRILPRMRVTYVEPGDMSFEELMAELKDGVLIVDTAGGNAESDGTFFFVSQEAWRVKNGEKVEPLKPIGMIGNVLDVLSKVKGLGKELSFRPGTCGKWGQSVPVSVGGAPTLTELRLSPTA